MHDNFLANCQHNLSLSKAVKIAECIEETYRGFICTVSVSILLGKNLLNVKIDTVNLFGYTCILQKKKSFRSYIYIFDLIYQ